MSGQFRTLEMFKVPFIVVVIEFCFCTCVVIRLDNIFGEGCMQRILLKICVKMAPCPWFLALSFYHASVSGCRLVPKCEKYLY